MLYKKIHRQYVKKFWKGRKLEYFGKVYEIFSEKPHMKRSCIFGYCICVDSWILIFIYSGKMYHTDDIKLLD